MTDLNSKYVRPLSEVIKETEDEAVEAAWEGDMERSDQLMQRVADMRDRLALGELYEIMF